MACYLVAWIVGYQWRGNILEYDVSHYYGYLPAIFEYQDPTFSFLDDLPEESRKDIDYNKRTPDGRFYFNKVTMGVAYLYLPFYLVGKGSATLFGVETHSFSNYYGGFILFGGMLYGILGLILLSNILKRYFNDRTVAISLIGLALGTNFFNYAVAEGGMSHVYSFFLFALALWLTIRYYEKPNMVLALGLGGVVGLIILIRPTNILVLIPLFFWEVENWNDLRGRLSLVTKKSWHFLPAVIVALCVFFPQFVYWKKMTGEWVYYSYQREGFDFLQPAILKGLFSFRKGWLIYTPLMISAVAGMIYIWFTSFKKLATPICTYFCLSIFVIFSWHSWWYGGSFGARALVETYVFLAIPMAVIFQRLFISPNAVIRKGIIAIVAFMVLLNLHQTYQYTQGWLLAEDMNFETYIDIFGKWR